MKLSDKISQYRSSQPFYTFEFFPPRTNQGFDNLIPRISRLCASNPLAISITWGAGGSTKSRSLELATFTQAECAIDTILHLTCTNMQGGLVDEVLMAAKEAGIENILALRGDPPRGEEHWIPVDSRFTHGIDLVSYIRSSSEFSSTFCIGVAAYPDGHPGSDLDEDRELEFLKAKVDAGADFIVTQLFYDTDRFKEWIQRVRQKGINVPIIPGIMPIQTYSSFLRLTNLCGSRIPPSLMSALEAISHDDQMVKDFGVTLAVDMVRKLTVECGIKGFQFCTMNLEKSIQRVLEALKWTYPHHEAPNRLIAETPGPIIHPPPSNSPLVVTPVTATETAARSLTSQPFVDDQSNLNDVNNAATWDDFPNGRFGDSNSPAFGIQGQWGGFSISRADAFAQWGFPKSLHDLTQMFLQYLHSEISSTPFSPTPLSSESLLILPHLENLTNRGWWTVGSQPAVDSASSSDEVIGWGPVGGYVFQKAFVEFFAELEDVEMIERQIEAEGKEVVHFFAGNNKGEFRSNVATDVKNTVTWGAFPGKEIVQTTIIEQGSFLSWKEEAFSIWSEWASFCAPGSEERKVLESVRDERWLVTIIHHDFRDPEALWTFLFNDSTASPRGIEDLTPVFDR